VASREQALEGRSRAVAQMANGRGRGKCGRTLSYVAMVQGSGNQLKGKAYTALLGLEPGDEFEIKLGRKQIKLTSGSAEEE